ncbi:MAG: SIS domain-containing protein [Candidatus Marinimicrobia bacterium]|nr:SIS domain-containing protein [Candidatus Neomarinimicrobiota bacterium]
MINRLINDHIDVSKALINHEKLIHDISKQCLKALLANRKIILCGNGGSAADSIHIAAELVGRFNKDRRSLPALSIASNPSNLTAISNDYGFEYVFSRQIEGLGNEGDILIALSTSGNSKNIIKAIHSAKNKKMITIGFTGKTGGEMTVSDCNYYLKIDSDNTARIQEMHLLVGHIICQYIDSKI